MAEKSKERMGTGQKDKNGKEIYEGDVILMYDWLTSVVRWEDGMFTIVSDDGEHYPLAKVVGPIEVIRNIYENPELLK